MKKQAIFYHAGCPVCVNAGQSMVGAFDKSRFDIEVVHLGSHERRLAEAVQLGVKSVPALVLGSQAFHVNFGASLSDLK